MVFVANLSIFTSISLQHRGKYCIFTPHHLFDNVIIVGLIIGLRVITTFYQQTNYVMKIHSSL